MQLAARTGAWSGKALPYDAEVEYLESHGTEWIDTGIVPNYHFVGYCEMMYLEYVTTDSAYSVFGVFDAWATHAWAPVVSQAKNLFYPLYGNVDRWYALPSKSLNVWHSVLFGGGDAAFDGTSFQHLAYPQNDPTKNCYLFGINNNNGPHAIGAKKRIRVFTLRDENGVLVRDFLPVLDLVGRPAMYDRVSGTLFYNQGTGEFAYGPIKRGSI